MNSMSKILSIASKPSYISDNNQITASSHQQLVETQDILFGLSHVDNIQQSSCYPFNRFSHDSVSKDLQKPR